MTVPLLNLPALFYFLILFSNQCAPAPQVHIIFPNPLQFLHHITGREHHPSSLMFHHPGFTKERVA